MECPICDTEMILALATNFGSSYYYCRSCKKELAEMSPFSPKAEPLVCKHSNIYYFYPGFGSTLFTKKCINCGTTVL